MTMDDETFKLLASFIIKSRRSVGAIDATRLANDPEYASLMFERVEEFGDEELVMIVLRLKDKMGLLKKLSKNMPPATFSAMVQSAKYKLGARG
jgi:hypothetical protein